MADAWLSVEILALQTLVFGLTFRVAGQGLRDHWLDAQNHELAFMCWTDEAGVRIQGLAEHVGAFTLGFARRLPGFRVDGVG